MEQNLGGFLKVVRRKITEPEKLANEGIVGAAASRRSNGGMASA